MSRPLSTALRQFFISELEIDSNATLDIARLHLRDLYDRGPDDPAVSSSVDLLAETEELLETYEPHQPLSDMVLDKSR